MMIFMSRGCQYTINCNTVPFFTFYLSVEQLKVSTLKFFLFHEEGKAGGKNVKRQ